MGKGCLTLDDFLSGSSGNKGNLYSDFLDNLLFAKGFRIIGSENSSFVRFACLHGENEPESPSNWISAHFWEAYVDLYKLWKSAYLSDIALLSGNSLQWRRTPDWLAKESYPVFELDRKLRNASWQDRCFFLESSIGSRAKAFPTEGSLRRGVAMAFEIGEVVKLSLQGLLGSSKSTRRWGRLMWLS